MARRKRKGIRQCDCTTGGIRDIQSYSRNI
nr:MAG TPA: hypothetical protein [Caudoviricetes sp.]